MDPLTTTHAAEHDRLQRAAALDVTSDHQSGESPSSGHVPPTISGYRIVREIGRGGMGVVYEADQIALGRRVALKVLPLNPTADGRGLERFRHEARAAARLHHTNIVPVFEVGEEAGICYYAMQLVRGQPLDEVIDQIATLAKGEAPLSSSGLHSQYSALNSRSAYFRSVARLGIQAAEALDYAHKEGVIHRDIKPSNLLLDAEGRVWVADFGLAKTEGEGLTQTGDVVGTLRYMAPERFHGWADPRSDVYALGLTLYELLLLRPAFDAADRLKLIHQITHDEPPRLRQVDPGLPRDLETIVTKAIEREPSSRYLTAAALAEDLRLFVEDKPISARRLSSVERLGRWCRRNPVVASLVTALVVVLLGGLVGIASQWWRAEGNAAVARAERDDSRTATENLRTALERLRHTAYVTDMNLAQHSWAAGGVSRVHELLQQHLPQPGESDLRGFEWHYLHRLCHSDKRTLLISGGTVALSLDGKRFASSRYFNGNEAEVTVWDTETGQSLGRIGGLTRSADRLTFCPEGTHLAGVLGDRSVRVWDIATGKEAALLEGHEQSVSTMAFSPDGQRLACATWTGVIKIWDWRKSEALVTFRPWPNTISGNKLALAFSPNGQRLAAVAPLTTVKVCNAADGKGVLECHPQRGTCEPVLAFSPDGKSLAGATPDHQVILWDARTGQPTGTLSEHTEEISWLAFSPDSRRLVSTSWDKSLVVWDVVGKQMQFGLRGHTSGVVQASFTADGNELVSTNGTEVKTWEARTGLPALVTFADHTDAARGVAFSPDGKRLASASDDGTIRVRDVTTGEPVFVLKRPPSVRVVAFSPDGSRIVGAGGTVGAPVNVWDSRTGEELPPIKPQPLTQGIDALAYHPTEKHLALAGRGEDQRGWSVVFLIVVDLVTGAEFFQIQENGIDPLSVVYSPDGHWLTTGSSDGQVRVWDAKTGQLTFTVTGQAGRGGQLAFSPLGDVLASAGSDGFIWVGDFRTGRTIHVLKGHTGQITHLAFSPDGQRLASASGDKSVKVWDLVTGGETLTLRGHKEWVMSVAFSPNGFRLASGGWDHTVRMWDAVPLPEKRSPKNP